MQTRKANGKKKVWPWMLASVIVLVIAAAIFLGLTQRQVEASFQSYTVARGNVESTITGSGKLQTKDVEYIDLPDNILVSQVLVKAGDQIKKGDALAILDYKSLAERSAYFSDELARLDRNISNRETSQYIYAPVEGRIKHVSASKGSDVVGTVGEEGALALISADGLMKIEVATNEEFALDAKVTVKWDKVSKTGKVARKTASGYVITLTDKETPYKETAQVYSDDTLIGEGTIEINAPISVHGIGGTIKEVHYGKNAYVYVGDTLFTLENAVVTNNYHLALAERNNIAEQLQAVMMYLNNPQVIATFDGLISEVLISGNTETGSGNPTGTSVQSSSSDVAGGNVGATGSTAQLVTNSGVAAGSGFSTAFSVHTGGAVKMVINVDELDINSVVLNQEVIVTLDAFAGEFFKAKVAHISKLGVVSGNVTTYPVELSLDYNERLYEGMNGSAVITVERTENVLVIPIEAIHEDSSGIYVYITEDNGQTRTRVGITTGISDGVNVEVTSGLSENDVIQFMNTNSSYPEGMGGFGGNPFGGDRFPNPTDGGNQ